MKRLVSILFVAMMLLSVMHLSFAEHLCGDEIAAVKLSITGERASCGMEKAATTCPDQKSYEAESCCKDELFFLTVDNNYNPSTFQLSQPTTQPLPFFYAPEKSGLLIQTSTLFHQSNVQPPGDFIACTVSLPDICEFRI